MKYPKTKVQLPFGLKDGVIKHIDEVENGLKCDCLCPKCKNDLIARNNGEIRSHHFAHTDNSDCQGAVETAIHQAAKQIICNSTEIATPEFKINSKIKEEISSSLLDSFRRYSDLNLSYKTVEEEKTVRDFRVDVALFKNEIPIFIEITVTHKTPKNKILNFLENGELLFEIDLRKWIKKDFSIEEFKEAILNSSDNRKWLIAQRKPNNESLNNASGIISNTHELKATNSFWYLKNGDNFKADFDRSLKECAPVKKEKAQLFLSDIKKLQKALDINWRINRVKLLRAESVKKILKVRKLISEGRFNASYLKPSISNVWILEEHSDVWQYHLVKQFITNDRLVNSFYLDRVVNWLSKKYSVLPFIKRLNNLNVYNDWNSPKFNELMERVIKIKMPSIPILPSYFTVSVNYLNALVEEGFLRRKLSRYTVK